MGHQLQETTDSFVRGAVPSQGNAVRTIAEAFCQHLKSRCPHKSYKNDVSRLRAFFGQICEELKLGRPGGAATKSYPDKFAHAHVTVESLEDVTPYLINRFISDRMREDAWSPKTANDFREVLHRLFVFAIKHYGYCSRDRRYPNPVAAVERQREPAPQIRFLTLEQIEEELRILENYPVIRALVATYIYAGLRREEALWLTREDIDLERRMIRVQAKTIENQTWQPKTRRNRAIPISARLFEILHDHRPPQECPWFFPSPQGKRWHPDNFSQDLRKINHTHGLDWGCLDFRHTFGSQLAQKGESLYKISTLMGNSPAICQRHYAALIPETMHDTVEFPTGALKTAAAPSGANDAVAKELLDRLLRELQARQGLR
ncbi:MAG: site-specific integrase [Planctomycetes bacterium]|nr:site-specific integrase [Planctomycetota bacterium]